ncbi:hypothetical protein JZ785_09940 [Alicyclobacillus curvatus]|nr:hypothetical protein JZ785_09940 [Alicyclobacillus curvatus]
MKYLCLGYYDQEKMDARPEAEIDEIMTRCQPHMDKLYNTRQVKVDAGVTSEVTCLQRSNGKVVVTDGPFVETKEMIGSALIVEAENLEEAIEVASLHPSLQMAEANQFGWRMEIRPIHYYQKSE